MKDLINGKFGTNAIKAARNSVLGITALTLAACASQPKETASDPVPAPVEQQAETTAAPAPAPAPVVEKAVEPAPEVKAAPAPAAAPKPVAVAKPVEKPKAPEEVEPAKPEVTAADKLVASLAAKDKYELITEEAPAPKPAEVSAKTTAKAVDAAVEAAPAPVAKASPALVQKALGVSRSDLPVTIQLWTLKQNPAPGQSDLIITTPTWEAGSGNYLSQIWLTLKEGRLEVNSSSDIDPSLAGSGVSVNGGPLESFDRVEGNKVAVLEGNWMERLATGGSLTVSLGFFPDKAKKSPVFKTEATLDALSRLVPTYYKLK